MKTYSKHQNNSNSEKASKNKQANTGTILQAFKSGTIQLKTDAERAAKHQRIALAKTEIAGKSIAGKLEKHLFEGHPNEGNFEVNEPTGLHAYTDGSLPTKQYETEDRRGRKKRETATVEHSVSGNENKIHTIDWKWDKSTSDATKSSTMFPKWMPKEHTIALVAGGLTSKTDQYVKHGLKFNVEHKGDTAYPVTE